MLTRVARARPEAQLDGFLVQQMVRLPGAIELIIGVVDDPVFGPVLMFGHGGTAAEPRTRRSHCRRSMKRWRMR